MSTAPTAVAIGPTVTTPVRLNPVAQGMTWALPTVLVGGGLLAEANGTMDALVLSACVLLLGLLAASLPGLAEKFAQRAFLLTFGNCVLAAGLCQLYSLRLSGKPLSFIDEVRFFDLIPTEAPYLSLAEWRDVVKGALATYYWQEWCALFRVLGFSHGPYMGALANCFVMGLSAALGVRAAEEVFGKDERRLSLVGTLHSLCGLFLLFGAILIRDCFVVIVNMAVLWGLLAALRKPTALRVSVAAGCLALGMACMANLRYHSVYMFALIAALAFGCWYWKKRGTLVRIALLIVLAICAAVGFSYLDQIVGAVEGELLEREEFYSDVAVVASSEDSLGLKYVINQPLPIRLTLGSFVLLAFPIPIWGQLKVGEGGVFVLQTYHALYMLWVVPMALAGAVVAFRRDPSEREAGSQFRFLLLYTLVGLLAVVATSREGRHFAQFFGGLLILAALPNRKDPCDRFWLLWMRILWIGLVALAHGAWALIRF